MGCLNSSLGDKISTTIEALILGAQPLNIKDNNAYLQVLAVEVCNLDVEFDATLDVRMNSIHQMYPTN